MDVIVEILEGFYSREEIYVHSFLPARSIIIMIAISPKGPSDVFQYILFLLWIS